MLKQRGPRGTPSYLRSWRWRATRHHRRRGRHPPRLASSCVERVRLAVIARRGCAVTRNTTPDVPNPFCSRVVRYAAGCRSEEHTSELQSQSNLVCRLLLEKKKKK